MKLVTKGRLTQNFRSSSTLREGEQTRAREVTSEIRVQPGEVVEIQLPRLSENDAGAFANRSFSIRIRTREIRYDGGDVRLH